MWRWATETIEKNRTHPHKSAFKAGCEYSLHPGWGTRSTLGWVWDQVGIRIRGLRHEGHKEKRRTHPHKSEGGAPALLWDGCGTRLGFEYADCGAWGTGTKVRTHSQESVLKAGCKYSPHPGRGSRSSAEQICESTLVRSPTRTASHRASAVIQSRSERTPE
jgi:hypothetical protein